MRLISFCVLKQDPSEPLFLVRCHELGFMSFFQRPFAKEHLNFGARTATKSCGPGESSCINIKEVQSNAYVFTNKAGVSVVIIADEEYPQKVILKIQRELFEEFYKNYKDSDVKNQAKDADWTVDTFPTLIKKYQDPKEADKLLKLQSELDDVTQLMYKNLDDIVARGETLDDMMKKSKDVSSMSYKFYKDSRKVNEGCCSLL
mmetsp:Transcript_23467/g.27185  ORF Transcript_23467/g.27185 Transcript_23467/m.27185 type:complete len:203 (+) Transcript_23467:51-659(+)